MSDVASSIQQTEANIAAIKNQIDLRTLVQRLNKNPDFKRLIEDEFMVKECANYAQLSADPALDELGRAQALGIAQAAGHLKRFLSVTVQKGNAAENQLPQYESFLDELRGEDANNG